MSFGTIQGGPVRMPIFTPQDHIAQVRAQNAQQRAQQAPKPQTAPGGIMPSRPGQPLSRAPAATPGRNPQFQGTRTPPQAQQMPPYLVGYAHPGGMFDTGMPGMVDPGYNKQIDPLDNPFGVTVHDTQYRPPPASDNLYGGNGMINPGGQNNNVILGGPPQLALSGQSQPATSKYQSTLNPGQSAAPTIAGAPAPGTSDSSPSQLYNNYASALFGKGGGTAPVGDTTAQTNQMQSMPVDQGYLPASQAQTQNQIYPQPYNTSPFNTLATPSAMPQSRMI